MPKSSDVILLGILFQARVQLGQLRMVNWLCSVDKGKEKDELTAEGSGQKKEGEEQMRKALSTEFKKADAKEDGARSSGIRSRPYGVFKKGQYGVLVDSSGEED